jgi:hypothetical protein
VKPRYWPKDWSDPAIRLETEELIYVKEIGYDKGLVISRPRITNNHPDHCHVVVEKGEVSMLDGIIGGGAGNEAMIRAEAGARMRIEGNHFEGFAGFTPDVFQSNGAEVLFCNNVIATNNKRVTLNATKRTIITGNRFANSIQGASLRALDYKGQGCENTLIADNIFQDRSVSAIEIGKLSREGVKLRDNFYTGSYTGEPVIYL